MAPGRLQLDGHQAATKLVTAVPYDKAQRVLSDLPGVRLGRERMHTGAHHVAAGLTVLDGAPSRAESARRMTEGAAGRWRRPALVRGIEGACGPKWPERARGRRPSPGRQRAKRALWRGQWREAQGVRFSLMAGERLVPVLSGPPVQTEDQRGEGLKQIKEARGMPKAQGRRCVVADGAAGIWQHGKALLPHACPGRD